jgi:putative membrane protein
LTALRGSIVPRVIGPVALLCGVAILIVALDRLTGLAPHLDGSAVTVFGIGLSLFLGFRNNAAYDRWWEARRLWGGLLADMRSLAREVEVFPGPILPRAGGGCAPHWCSACAPANLRRLSPQSPGKRRWRMPSTAGCRPDRLNAVVATAHRGGLDGLGRGRVGASCAWRCNRRAASGSPKPLPFVYPLIYRTIYLYRLLPFLALIGTTGWMTPASWRGGLHVPRPRRSERS